MTSVAHAGIVNLDEMNSYQWFGNGLIIQSKGFNIQSTANSGFSGLIANTFTCGPTCPDNGGYYLLGHGAGYKFTSVTNTPFSLRSFFGAEAHNSVTGLFATKIWVSAMTVNNVVIEQFFDLDWINDGNGVLNDFQKFTLSADFVNLKSVTFEGVGGTNNFFSIDNIDFSKNDVPAPASLLLLSLGLLGIATRRVKSSS
jgi:hypothetical protein